MVQDLTASLFRASVATRFSAFLERSIGFQGPSMSIREIARRTGFPRSTLQDFLADPNRARARTVDRIAGLLDDERLQTRSQGIRTDVIDAPGFGGSVLGDIIPPEGAVGVAFVYEAEGYTESGFARTPLADLDSFSIEEASGLVPGGSGSIRRVVFEIDR